MTEDTKKAMLEFADLIEKGIAQGILHTTVTWVDSNGKACSIGTAWLANGRTGMPFASNLVKVFPFLGEFYSTDEGKELELIDIISDLDMAKGREAVIKWLREKGETK